MKAKPSILLLESDPDLAGAIDCYLEPVLRTTVAKTIEKGADLFRDDRFVGMMVNVDITRKTQEVLDFITRLRADGDERFVVTMSSWDTDELPTRLYEAGADAFVSMPFRSYAEILSLLRRHSVISAYRSNRWFAGQLLDETSFRFAGASISPDLMIRFANGHKARLHPKAAGILRLFSRKDGCLVKRSEIMAAVWGRSAPRSSSSLDVYLSQLRRLFRAHGMDLSQYVSSRRGAGWWISQTSTASASKVTKRK